MTNPDDKASHAAPQVVPVISESLAVEREREITGEVRVRIRSSAVTEHVTVDCMVQKAHVERVTVGRPCSERENPRYEADVLIIPVYEEVVTLSRQLVLKEELRVTLISTTASTVQAVELQREEAVVERLQPDGTWDEESDS